MPLWAATELETKRERYKDYVDSLTEKYKVFQFSQETINHFKEKRKSIDDATGGGGGGSGSGSDKGGEEQNDKVATTTTTISGDTKSPASGSSSSDLVAELSVGVSNN